MDTEKKDEIMLASELTPDDHNFNRGTDEGRRLLRQSLERYGAGRSMLLDRDNRIIAGNKTQEQAAELGMKVRIVDADADTIIAVRRQDVTLDSEQGRTMALLDNLTTQVNLSWDETELQAVAAEVEGFDANAFGFDVSQLPDNPYQDSGEGQQGESQQKPPTNSELDVDGFSDKIKMVLELSIEEHAYVQQALSRDGMTKEQVLLNLLGYGTE